MSDTFKTAVVYVGAGVASFFAPQFAPLFFGAAGIAASIINKPEATEGSRLTDTSFSGSSYGAPINRGWATFPVAGTYIWAPDLREEEHEEGGKGSGPESIWYSYSASFAVLLAEGPVTRVRRLWFDTELVFDAREDSDGAYQKDDLYMTVYLGNGTQDSDPVIESVEGVGNVPAWRKYCYIVVNDLPLENYGNRRPNVRAELVSTPDQDSNRQITTTKGDSHPRYNENDDTVITVKDNYFNRWDKDTGELLSSVYVGDLGQTDAWVIDDNGIIHGWQWNTDGGPANHWYPIQVNSYTGARYTSDCAAGTCPTCSNCEAKNFNAIIKITIIDGDVYYYTGIGSVDGLVINPWDTTCNGCSAEWVVYTGTSVVDDLSFIVEDSDGYIWRSFASTEIITIFNKSTGVTTTINMSVTHGLSLSSGNMQWHPPSQSMFIDTTTALVRMSFDGATTTIEATSTVVASLLSSYETRYHYEPTIWTKGAVTTWYHLDSYTLATIRTKTPITGWQSSIWHNDLVYVKSSNSIFGNGGVAALHTTNQMLLDRVPAGDEDLSVVVAELCRDLKPSQIDVTDLDDLVHGFPVTKPEDVRQTVSRLFPSHLFGAVESDAAIKFKHIPSDPVVTIPEDDLAAHIYGNAMPDNVVIERSKDTAFPKRVEVAHLSYKREYEVLTQGASKQNTPSTEISKVELTEVLTPDEAKQLAEKFLHSPRDERNELRFDLSNKYLYLDPLDEINITKGSSVFRVRLMQTDWSTPGIVKCVAITTNPVSYDSDAIGADPDFDGTVITTIKQSYPWLLDAPILSASEDLYTPGYYAGVTSDASATFTGATLFRAVDKTSLDATVQTTMGVESAAGRATTVLADTDNTTTWDDVSTVDVVLLNGELTSSTDDLVIQGDNVAFIGSELIQFVDVVDNGDSSYTLSRLLRGRRGTEWATDSHTTNDQFVVVTVPSTYNVYTNLTTQGVQHYYRAVSYRLPFLQSIPVAFTNTNVRLKPFSPVNAEVTVSVADLIFTWTRRTRVFLPPDYSVIPLGEVSEAYEIDIIDTDGVTVLNTYSATSETYTYTAAQQATDFGAGGVSGFDFKIYQIGDGSRRGYPLEASTNGLGLLLPVWTDFDEGTAGDTITNWTNRSKVNRVSFQYADSGSTPAATSTVGRVDWIAGVEKAFLTFDNAVPAINGQILVKGYFQANSTADRPQGVCIRATGLEYDTEDMDAYVAWVDKNGDCKIAHYYYEESPFPDDTPGTPSNLSLTDGDPYWIRVETEGTTIRVEYSASDIDGVAPTWDYEITDTQKTTAGYFGIFVNAYYEEEWDFDKFAVAYNGENATFS